MRPKIVAGMASILILYACVFCAASTPADPTAWTLKTPKPDAAKAQPFLDGITSLRSEITAGKIPPDAKTRLAQANTTAASFLQQTQALVAALKQNNETAAFDALMEARLAKSQFSTLVSQVKRAGGATAVLAGAKKDIDEDLVDLSATVNAKVPGAAANIIFGGVLSLFETQNAEAVYGGGVAGTCSLIKVLYYIAISVDPRFCIH